MTPFRCALLLLLLVGSSSPYSINRAAFLKRATSAACISVSASSMILGNEASADDGLQPSGGTGVDADTSFVSTVKKGTVDGKNWVYALPGKWTVAGDEGGFLDSEYGGAKRQCEGGRGKITRVGIRRRTSTRKRSDDV